MLWPDTSLLLVALLTLLGTHGLSSALLSPLLIVTASSFILLVSLSWCLYLWRVLASFIVPFFCWPRVCVCVCVCVWVTLSCLTICNPIYCSLFRLFCPWDFPGNNTGMCCHSLLQVILPTQVLDPCLPHCRKVLCHLSLQGSPNEVVWECMFTEKLGKGNNMAVCMQFLKPSFYHLCSCLVT